MNRHRSESSMSPSFAGSYEQFKEIVRRAEDREAVRMGCPLPEARKTLGRRWEVASSTLHNLRRGRLKDLPSTVYARLTSGILADLDADIRRLQHDKHVLLQVGSPLGGDEILQIEAWISKARAALDAVKK
jgi:hypothetical protein